MAFTTGFIIEFHCVYYKFYRRVSLFLLQDLSYGIIVFNRSFSPECRCFYTTIYHRVSLFLL